LDGRLPQSFKGKRRRFQTILKRIIGQKTFVNFINQLEIYARQLSNDKRFFTIKNSEEKY
jgi:hypothetical protein